MNPELWLPVAAPFHERYEVSSLGNVRRRWNGKALKATRSTVGGKPGYMKVTLTAGSLCKHVSVHRLVAHAFVSGDTNADVNHKDLDKTNNVFTNLEWVTHAENIAHGMRNNPDWLPRMRAAGGKRRHSVIATASDGRETAFDSITAAAQSLGSANKAANIIRAIAWGSMSYGFRWRKA